MLCVQKIPNSIPGTIKSSCLKHRKTIKVLDRKELFEAVFGSNCTCHPNSYYGARNSGLWQHHYLLELGGGGRCGSLSTSKWKLGIPSTPLYLFCSSKCSNTGNSTPLSNERHADNYKALAGILLFPYKDTFKKC